MRGAIVVAAIALALVLTLRDEDLPVPEIDYSTERPVWWSKLTRSDVARRHDLDNTPPQSIWPELQRTWDIYLTWFSDVANISSGYRSPEVNAAAGSGFTSVMNPSYHVLGRAMDLVPVFPFTMVDVAVRAEEARAAGVISGWLDETDCIHVQWR